MAARSSTTPVKVGFSSSVTARPAGPSAPSSGGAVIQIRPGAGSTASTSTPISSPTRTNIAAKTTPTTVGRVQVKQTGTVAASPAKTGTNRIVIAARPGAAAGVAASPSKPISASNTASKAASVPAATPNKISSATATATPTITATPTTTTTVTPSKTTAPSSDLPSGPRITSTPHGINLDLSGSNPVPQLVATRSRSDRLREACLSEDRLEVVNLLVQGTDPNQCDAYGNTALMLAAGTGNVDVCEELLAHGASVHMKDKYGQTPLIFACSKAHYEVAKLLIERKAGVNVATMHGQTALMKVCYISHPHTSILAELLLTHKAKPDVATSEEGLTALLIAVDNDHVELCELLAHYGADLNLARKDTGDTALHLAATRTSFAMVASLIAMGARTDVRNAAGKTFEGVEPRIVPGAAAPMPLDEFRRKLSKALDRGLALKESRAEEAAENAALLAKLQAEKLERARADLVAVKVADGLTLAAAQHSAAQDLGDESERTFYIDADGVEHYSRPASAKLSYAEMKARTYKPKIDPTSVFGDATATLDTTTLLAHHQTEPKSYGGALADVRSEEEGESEDEMQIVGY